MSAEAGQLSVGEASDADSQIQDLKKRIRSFDMMYARHQQEGKSFEALEFLEKGLFLRKELLGAEHPEVSKVCQVFTTSCNTLAMNALQKENFMVAFELLKKGEILTSSGGYIHDKKIRMKLRAVTFNNFGCFYKRRGKLHAALQYLARALKIELASQDVDNPAGTHLNLCATLSQLNRHGPALEHADCALELLQNMHRGEQKPGVVDDASILAIAWHNRAVEQEHLSQNDITMLDEALKSYGQAVAVAEREWGPQHIKTLAIKNSFDEAKEKARERQKKASGTGLTSGAATSSLDALLGGSAGGHKAPSKHASKMQASSPLKKGSASAKVSGPPASMPAQRIVNRSAASNWNDFISSGANPNSAAFIPASGASVSLPPIVEEKRCALIHVLFVKFFHSDAEQARPPHS
jgi:tetratricopeptide (TPR) repeat protein